MTKVGIISSNDWCRTSGHSLTLGAFKSGCILRTGNLPSDLARDQVNGGEVHTIDQNCLIFLLNTAILISPLWFRLLNVNQHYKCTVWISLCQKNVWDKKTGCLAEMFSSGTYFYQTPASTVYSYLQTWQYSSARA